MAVENFGPYQLIRKLAAGGMAEIYLARRRGVEGFEKLLVVKRILPHLNENLEFVTMFIDEARNSARLNHPNIVQIFDLGQHDRSYFIAMEFIHGEDLRRVWKRSEAQGRPLPVPLVCRIIIDACSGLDYAHKKVDQAGKPLNIVHRDISPQNILITYDGGVKVVDFGIAKAADQATVTRSGVLKGKYSYMSPEQGAGRKVDRRTDIFALGVVLYELLTGTRLFKRSNDIQTLNAVAECIVVPPSQVQPRVPASLDAVVLKALAKEADDRYQSALELQLALEDWLMSNQLASSSAHLAAFMQELYAERLAREARAGGPAMVDEGLEAARAPEPPSLDKSPRAQSRSSSRREHNEARPDATSSPRTGPTRSLGPKKPERVESAARKTRDDHGIAGRAHDASIPTAPGLHHPVHDDRGHSLVATEVSVLPRARRRWVVGVSAAVGVAAAAVLAYPVFTGGQGAGAGGPNTPTTAERASPTRARVVPGATSAPAASKVLVTLRTSPDGAHLWVDGQDRGRAPVTVEAEPGESLRVQATAAGHEPLANTVAVGESAVQTLELTLERSRTPPQEREPVHRPPPEPKDVRGAVGTVRFTVVPITAWATVACGGQKLGDTPMQDQKLPVGVHDCTFSNPDLGTKTQRVEVRANTVNKVTVKF